MKLYADDHCPFCVKVGMIFGIKKIDYELIILQNNDESTPQVNNADVMFDWLGW